MKGETEMGETEMTELGFEIPKARDDAPKPKPKKGDGSIGVLELERMDFAALREEYGDCEDESGVSLWAVLELLRGHGVKEVNLI